MNQERYPELVQFFAGYFNQDWDLDAPTADGIIDLFNRTHSLNERAHIAVLIDAFTAEVRDDAALTRAMFDELGCFYTPEADGMSMRSWLQHVSSRLRETN